MSDDDRLRAALSQGASDKDPVDPDRIWAAAAGEIRGDELAELLARVRTDPALAREWQLAVAARREAATAKRSPRGLWWGLAAGAGTLLAAALALLWIFSAPEPEYRGDGDALSAVTDDGAELSREAATLTWEPAGDGWRYDVQVTTVTLDKVAAEQGLTHPTYTVPAERLREIPAGSTLLWSVDAWGPKGAHRTTGTHEVLLK